MRYLFIGNMDELSKEYRLNKRSIPQNQMTRFQMSFLDGLIDNVGNHNVEAVSLPLFGSFLISNSKFLSKKKNLNHRGINLSSPFFINLPLLKNVFWSYFILKKIRLIRKNYEVVNIIFCSITNNSLIYPLMFRKKNNIIFTVIIVDLPKHVNASLYFHNFRNFRLNFFKRSVNRFDKFIFITDQINQLLNKDEDQFIVIDGFITPQVVDIPNKELLSKKIIIYAGTLDVSYGIMDLLKVAKNTIGLSVEFWIFGYTDSKILLGLMEDYSNIKYYGYLDKLDLYSYYRFADAFIIPRPIGLYNNEYSNPSKLYEYLSFKKPVIINDLPSIPEDLKSVLLINENFSDSILGMTNLVVYVLEEKAIQAKDYQVILNKRSPFEQLKKYINIL